MISEFNQRLKSGETLFGTMVTLGSATVAEVLAQVGFDWLFVDCEHGPIETAELASILQTVQDRSAVLVRVPAIDETPIKKALDLGAHGIIVPQVNTAEQATRVVEFTRYPPLGGRGIGLARAQGYGAHFEEYITSANDSICVVVQAEHVKAVDNIEAIVQVEGLDAVLIGPYDLSASLGLTGQVDHPEVLEAIAHVTEACEAASMPLGIFGTTADAVKPQIEQGFTLIVAGIDLLLLSKSAAQLLAKLRGA
ncbi:MAG: HpcH/HpaI aldolase/citrate lyase family protein [Mariniblastus sp.]